MKLYDKNILILNDDEIKGILTIIGKDSNKGRVDKGMPMKTAEALERFYFEYEDEYLDND